jgi:hypothetical protein
MSRHHRDVADAADNGTGDEIRTPGLVDLR